MRSKSVYFFILMILLSPLGCGGSGSDGTNENALTGFFVDSPVQGLNYSAATGLKGITTEDGGFRYLSDENISFSVGKIHLGTTKAKQIITPIDLVPGAADETNPTVVNILRFLQTLDEDDDPSNGIRIDEIIRSRAQNVSIGIDFNVSTTDFSPRLFSVTLPISAQG